MMYATAAAAACVFWIFTSEYTQKHASTHFDRATFQFDELLEQSIKIPAPFIIIITSSNGNAYYYCTYLGEFIAYL